MRIIVVATMVLLPSSRREEILGCDKWDSATLDVETNGGCWSLSVWCEEIDAEIISTAFIDLYSRVLASWTSGVCSCAAVDC